jgi:hypothetical protein
VRASVIVEIEIENEAETALSSSLMLEPIGRETLARGETA